MNKPTASLLVLVVLVSLFSFGSDSQRNSSATAANKRSARSAVRKTAQPPAAPPTNIGFLSPPRMVANGAIFGIFPAVMGDFKGDGNQDAATMVNTSPGTPHYSISAAMNNGSGSFTTVLTATKEVQQDPIFVADLNGDGKDDILIVHPAVSPGNTTIQAYLSNGDGTFTAGSQGTVVVTTNGFVWATVADVNGDGCPDVVLADALAPNGNIWTVLGKSAGTCDGSFGTPTAVALTGALSAGSPMQGVPGNPMVFADFNGDGKLDFAAAAAPGGMAAANQIVVYLNNGAGGYTGPTLLANPGTPPVYDSCFLGGGVLTTGGKGDLVSANCLDGNITAYVNDGSGVFKPGVYYSAGARPQAISVADVNGDGNGDIVVTDLNSAAIRVLLGKGDGTVNPASEGYVTGGAPLMPALIAHFSGASNPVGVVLPDNQTNFVSLEGYGDGTFRSGINYYSLASNGGFQPEGVGLASGDFNGDGIPDFVIGNSDCAKCNTASVTVFISNPDGSLQPGVNYFPPTRNYVMQYVAVADFNGDGILDIAASDSFNSVIQIFYGKKGTNGKADGTFKLGPTFATDTTAGAHPVGIVTADFNGDGKPDLAIVNNFGPANAPTSADVGVLINNGTGGFNPVVNYPNGGTLSTVATELTAADLNGDKKLDLVVPLYGICSGGTCTAAGSAVAVFLGNGDGTFGAESDVPMANASGTRFLNPYDAAVGDLNGDGKADLAVTMQDVKGVTQGIAVALGNGDGTFQPATLLASSPQNPLFAPPPLPGYVKIVDLNRDGHPDLVYTNALEGGVGVLYGLGDGTFYDAVEFAADRWAWDFALVDVNNDGVLDVVASGFQQSFSGVGVLLNTSGNSTALTSSALTPTTGQSVTFTATITGSKVRGVTTVPTGSVTFFDGTTALGAAAPISSGVATTKASFATAGTHNITAQYSGDMNYVPTTSAAVQETVGNGGAPDYTLAANPTSATVNAGSSATYTITLMASNNYNGTVTIACPTSGLPAGVTCNTPVIAAGQTQATLTINTAPRKAALLTAPDINPHHGEPNLWASLSGLGMIGMILVGDWKRRNRRGLAIVLLIVALAMILALVGCGGGSTSGGGGGGGGGGTPAGSYPITVTATDGGKTTTHMLNLTLVVN